MERKSNHVASRQRHARLTLHWHRPITRLAVHTGTDLFEARSKGICLDVVEVTQQEYRLVLGRIRQTGPGDLIHRVSDDCPIQLVGVLLCLVRLPPEGAFRLGQLLQERDC